MSIEALGTITNSSQKVSLGSKMKNFFLGKGKENRSRSKVSSTKESYKKPESKQVYLQPGRRLVQSAPASPRASRANVASHNQSESANLSKGETLIKAGRLYKSFSQTSLNSISASDSFSNARNWLDQAKGAKSDDDRIKFFKFAEQYAEYAVAFGRKDAVGFIHNMYKEGFRSSDGSRVLIEDSNKNIFWNNVSKKQKAKLEERDIGHLGFVRNHKDKSLGATVFIHVSNVVHNDPNTQHSIEYANKLLGYFRAIQSGKARGVPHDMSQIYAHRSSGLIGGTNI